MQIDKSKKFGEFFEACNNQRRINFLVLHHVEANSANHAIEQFKEHQVSSHFVVDESGEIFELVDENDVAYHAGVSFWNGVDGLNKTSIGIEFINSKPFEKSFEKEQMIAGVQLCKYLIAKYNIAPRNVVGHSDIAYDRTTNLIDRKQDPSHLFDWKFLSENGVGIFPKIDVPDSNVILFREGDCDAKISQIKNSLKTFGYRVINTTNNFDEEMVKLTTVFNRRFLGVPNVSWTEKAETVLNSLLETVS